MTGDALIVSDMSCLLSDHERSFRMTIPDFRLDRSQMVAGVGESGTGKTLFLELLGLLRQPAPGTAYGFHGSDHSLDLMALWSSRRGLARERARLFGFVPQTGGLIGYLTAWKNAELPQVITGRRDLDWLGHLFDVLELSALRNLTPDKLSIGQRQRVAIARALAHKPPFVIADEPTAALDPRNAARVMALFVELVSQTATGVVLSTHNLALLDSARVQRLQMQVCAGSDPRMTEVRLTSAGHVAA